MNAESDENEAREGAAVEQAHAAPERHGMSGMARLMMLVGAVLFLVTGAMYVVVPATALNVFGVEASPTSEFLLRTQGVALLFGGVLLLVATLGRLPAVVLLALAAYLVGESVVEVAAFAQGFAGPAAVPAAITRIGLGVLSAAVALRRRDPAG